MLQLHGRRPDHRQIRELWHVVAALLIVVRSVVALIMSSGSSVLVDSLSLTLCCHTVSNFDFNVQHREDHFLAVIVSRSLERGYGSSFFHPPDNVLSPPFGSTYQRFKEHRNRTGYDRLRGSLRFIRLAHHHTQCHGGVQKDTSQAEQLIPGTLYIGVSQRLGRFAPGGYETKGRGR